VPLKTARRYFVLHKTISIPARISDDKFVQYLLDFTYFGLGNIHRIYILFTEADLIHCSKGSITVCFADKAVYTTLNSNERNQPVFSRRQTTTDCVREYCSYTTKLRPYSDTVLCGCITFRMCNTSLPDVGRMAVGYLAPRISQGPVYFTMLRDIPSPPMDSRRYRI
jgi:hypothetical protein